MPSSINGHYLFRFPKEVPEITAAVILDESSCVITGHENGLLALWDMKGQLVFREDCGSKVTSISVSSNRTSVLVGCHSGRIVLFDISMRRIVEEIQPATFSKHSRVWRVSWIDGSSFVQTSTYGTVYVTTRKSTGIWESTLLQGHYNSVFGLSAYGNTLATGDYQGHINIWTRESPSYQLKDSLKVIGSIEAIDWLSETLLAVITIRGHVYLIEADSHTSKWHIVFDVFVASTGGKSLKFSGTEDYLFAATNTEIIQIDIRTQQIVTHKLPKSVVMQNKEGKVVVLTGNGVFEFDLLPIETPLSLIKYKFAKISLIGHTGVGKSTLCNAIVKDDRFDSQSTYGKEVWEWNLGKDTDGIDRRVVFHDHGGQESVLYTFFPFLSDSDVILLLFKKTDISTLDKVISALPEIREYLTTKTKMFLVETFIDESVEEVTPGRIRSVIAAEKIATCFEVSGTSEAGMDSFKSSIISEIDWGKARTVIETQYADKVLNVIYDIKKLKIPSLDVKGIQEKYKEKFSSSISKIHLKFLLDNFSSQGLIEYYPAASDLVIFGDRKYLEMRSNIPFLARGKNGIISIKEIEAAFPKSKGYVRIIDALFDEYSICIKDGDIRVFPKELRSGGVDLKLSPWQFTQSQKHELRVSTSKISHALLIQALSDMQLSCIDLTQNAGIFQWEKGAYIYYTFQLSGDSVEGFNTQFTFYVGGPRSQLTERLYEDFTSVIDRLYGPIVSSYDRSESKKNAMKHFELAISYATEQSAYVNAVAECLRFKGVRVFFDAFERRDLWGKDLATYFTEIYHSRSTFCLMFISEQYVSKHWTNLERRAALARQMSQNSEYILPVRFSRIEVPGLLPTIGYIEASDYTPEQLSDLVIGKLADLNLF